MRMQNKLQKAIDLVRKTGDRLLVYDMANPENAFALMSIDEYERLMAGKNEVSGLTEGQLIDKINRDIAIWKNENDFAESEAENLKKARNYLSDYGARNAFREKFAAGQGHYDNEDFDPIENDLYDKIEESIKAEISGQNKEKGNPWAIPPTRKEAAEEIIDEDTQYLEEIR